MRRQPSASTSIGRRVNRFDPFVEIRDRLFEHRPMGGGTRLLQIRGGTRSRQHQRGPLRSPRRFGRGDRRRAVTLLRCRILLRFNRLAFPAACHQTPRRS